VELATYAGGGHLWPVGDAATPAAGQVIWDFVNATSDRSLSGFLTGLSGQTLGAPFL